MKSNDKEIHQLFSIPMLIKQQQNKWKQRRKRHARILLALCVSHPYLLIIFQASSIYYPSLSSCRPRLWHSFFNTCNRVWEDSTIFLYAASVCSIVLSYSFFLDRRLLSESLSLEWRSVKVSIWSSSFRFSSSSCLICRRITSLFPLSRSILGQRYGYEETRRIMREERKAGEMSGDFYSYSVHTYLKSLMQNFNSWLKLSSGSWILCFMMSWKTSCWSYQSIKQSFMNICRWCCLYVTSFLKWKVFTIL